jgi:cytochrome c peroxidase
LFPLYLSPERLVHHLRAVLTLAFVAVAACSEAPAGPTPPADSGPDAAAIRRLFLGLNIHPMDEPPAVRPELVELGGALVFDRILSAERDISCMTCHYPTLGLGDSRSLPIGTGGAGLGVLRTHPRGAFVPRNSQALFDLGEFDRLFWDGRVEVDEAGNYHTLAGEQLTAEMKRVFEFGALAAQAMFPVTVREEMRGFGKDDLGGLADEDFTGIWKGLMTRLGEVPEYRRLFEAAYPGTPFDAMTFAHASNAMAGFMVARLTFANSPWDRFLRGEDAALTPAELEGAATFVSEGCASCHSGTTLSDGDFYNLLLPQLGPGKGDGTGGIADYGRARITGAASDRYTFRTPGLRNVELTGPWGHAGQYSTLFGIVNHHDDPEQRLREYDVGQLEEALRNTRREIPDLAATRTAAIQPRKFSPDVTNQLVVFLRALTHPAARRLNQLVPFRVPSGLPVD